MTRKGIGKQVEKEFKAKKITYYRLWKESGVKPHVAQSIMKGNADYTVKSLLKICFALDIEYLGNVKEQEKSL